MTPGAAPMPASVEVNGFTWLLYEVLFTTADGEFSTYAYAISDEHAAAVVEELKQTARLGGRVIGHLKA